MTTMIALQNRRLSITVFAFITVAMMATEFYIVNNAAFSKNAHLMSFAITCDIVVILPILFYFLIVRPLKLNPAFILSIYILSAWAVYFILPKTQHFYLKYVWHSLAFVEIGVMIWAVSKVKTIIKTYKSLSINSFDFYFNLKKSLELAIGNTVFTRVFATEIAIIRYGLLFFIQAKIEVLPHQKTFSVHKKSGYITIWAVLLFVGFVELFALHFLFKKFGNTVVLIADALSIYTLIFMVADLIALLRRPILIDNQQLTIRNGIRWHVIIDRKNIEKIEDISRLPADKDIQKIATLGEPNVLLMLKESIEITGFYGMRFQSKRLALLVDDKELFIKSLELL
jgi:hypothetical protein